MSELKRALGIPMLTFYGTGMILGAGIYSIIGTAADLTAESLWISFILASVVALLTAFSYAELATMFPKAGAEFIYLGKAFKKQKWFAETVGFAMAFSGAATAATVALAFSGYLNKFVEVPSAAVAPALLMILTAIALIGIRISGWANIIFTLIEIGGLGLIIYLGLQSEKFGEAISAAPSMGTLTGAALIIFSFFGFENIVNLAEEAKKPESHIPKAIFISLGVATALYILVSFAALALVPTEKLAQSSAALMTAAQASSENAGKILGSIALFATANTALIAMIGASRILYGMAKQHSLPEVMMKVASKNKTPWTASTVVLITALVLLPLGKVETVASVSALATLFAFIAVNLTLIRLRYTDSRRERPFRVPLSIGRLPLLPVFGVILCVVFLFQFEPTVYLVGGLFLLISAAAFVMRGRYKKRHPIMTFLRESF
ncbi:MAG: APC family permease [Bdellovibrionota bacterium]